MKDRKEENKEKNKMNKESKEMSKESKNSKLKEMLSLTETPIGKQSICASS